MKIYVVIIFLNNTFKEIWTLLFTMSFRSLFLKEMMCNFFELSVPDDTHLGLSYYKYLLRNADS